MRSLLALAFEEDLPEPLRALILVLPSTESITKQSPPTPVMWGSATQRTAFMAIAASTALPPFFRISIPTDAAIG